MKDLSATVEKAEAKLKALEAGEIAAINEALKGEPRIRVSWQLQLAAECQVMTFRLPPAALCLGLLAAAWLTLQAAASGQPQQPQPLPVPSPAARALREVFDFVLGSWDLEPMPGAGLKGRFSFEMDLGGRAVLHRIQVTGRRPLVRTGARTNCCWSFRGVGLQLRALYLDNDGKVVRFDVGFAHDSGTITFSSEAVAGQPRQRFTYRPLARDRMEVASEASSADGRGPLAVTSMSTWRRTKRMEN